MDDPLRLLDDPEGMFLAANDCAAVVGQLLRRESEAPLAVDELEKLIAHIQLLGRSVTDPEQALAGEAGLRHGAALAFLALTVLGHLGRRLSIDIRVHRIVNQARTPRDMEG
jgi:hypothetical protein